MNVFMYEHTQCSVYLRQLYIHIYIYVCVLETSGN